MRKGWQNKVKYFLKLSALEVEKWFLAVPRLTGGEPLLALPH